MTPDLMGVFAAVQEDLGDLMDALDQHGPVYARAYLEFLNGAGKRSPIPPRELPREFAAAIREKCLDQAAVSRMPSVRRNGRCAA